jgi:beta-lactamase class D
MPASTFKIPNSLIGLETGVIPDSNYVIKWDGKPGFIKEWDHDHTLKSAIYFSVVWYYQELARRVGRKKMQYWLNKINYGNNTIGDKVDYFWLDNSLKISANEQVEFVKKFYKGNLPFSKRSLDITKSILPEQDFKNAVLKNKTGTGKYEDGHYIAWLVGYVVKVQRPKVKGQSKESKEQSAKGKVQSEENNAGRNVYFFAFNVDAKTFDEAVELRNKIKNGMLEYLGVIQ